MIDDKFVVDLIDGLVKVDIERLLWGRFDLV